MSDYKVGTSPLTGRIYAGTVKKDGTWGANKKDVTDTAPGAVAAHLIQRNEIIEFYYKDGNKYELKVVKVQPAQSLKNKDL